ncbi:MAG: hypothetical protein EKK41_25430 [Hyphomicrobiales bacterium]|nr:MAG: hypothetical protein EKK41_25430 [Hyphomicrobiales bacterium]
MQLLTEILHLPVGTIYLISVICSLAMLPLRNAVPNLLVSGLLYAVTLLASLGAMSLAAEFHLFSAKSMGGWLLTAILSSAVGVVVGLLTLVASNRLISLLVARRIGAASPMINIRHVRLQGLGERD